MVCMEVLNPDTQQLKLTPINGVAKVLEDRLVVEEQDGNQVVIPDSALPSILPSDGEPLLGNADHYVVVKMGGVE